MSWIITGTQRYQPAALLDQFPGAAAAYSLRNLVGTSNPSVVRVRRDNDNAEQDFTATEVSDGTLAAWVGAGNDGFVRIWYDQSGNGNDATQANTANQPKIVDAGELVKENGKAALGFDGVDDSLSVNQSITCQSIFMALNMKDFTQNATTLSGFNDFTFNLQNRGGNTFRSGFANGSIFIDGNVTATYVGTNEFTLSIKNTQVILSQLADAAKTDATGIIFCRERDNAFFQSSNMQEMILYPTDQSTNRAAIEANINTHYNIF